MKWIPDKKRILTLVTDTRQVSLVEIIKERSAAPSHKILAQVGGQLDDGSAIVELLKKIDTVKGALSIVLPLSSFEIVTVSLPKIPEGNISKVLPYHLGKMISKPLSDYIYDWQLCQQVGDTIQITAYLYPAAVFHQIRESFSEKQLEIRFFEADIFSAFSYMNTMKNLQGGEVTLCVLMWPETISLAVYEGGLLPLVRSISVRQPGIPFGLDQDFENEPHAFAEEIIAGGELVEEPSEEGMGRLSLENADEAGELLKVFDLMGDTSGDINDVTPDLDGNDLFVNTEEAVSQPLDGDLTTSGTSWPEYIENVNLEIMRTRDYYASVVKGKAIKRVVVNGAEVFWEDLSGLVKGSLDMQIEALWPEALELDAEERSTVFPVCVGAVNR